jgi:uncharacterized membrane protein YgcG
MDNETTEKPSNKVIGAVTIGGLLFLLIAVASSFGAAIGFLGLVALVVGIVAVVRGGAAWARIVSRRAAITVAVAGFLAMAIGGALTPQTKTDNTASEAPAPTSSAAPTTAAPKTTQAAPQPLVAAPVTTSAAPVLPPAPVMAITCPAGGSVASPVYGQQISATAPFTVTIDYGDGDVYTNNEQNLPAIFSHTYKASGTFAVSAVLTDAVGQTTTATCSYTWTKPVQAASGGGSSSGTVSGGGAASGGGAVSGGGSAGGAAAGGPYANCDAVRAAGAAPIHAGDPGWQQKFDRDGDGVGCE